MRTSTNECKTQALTCFATKERTKELHNFFSLGYDAAVSNLNLKATFKWIIVGFSVKQNIAFLVGSSTIHIQ